MQGDCGVRAGCGGKRNTMRRTRRMAVAAFGLAFAAAACGGSEPGPAAVPPLAGAPADTRAPTVQATTISPPPTTSATSPTTMRARSTSTTAPRVSTTSLPGPTVPGRVVAQPPAPASASGTTPVPVAVETWCDASVYTCASTYVHWPGSTTTLAQSVKVRAIGRATYLALYWAGGYIGVQTDGNSVSGVFGPTAVFSMGGSGVLVRPLPDGVRNGNCQAGFDGDSGVSCRVPLGRSISPGDQYLYTVESVPGGWYRGTIRGPNGVVLFLADLKPSSTTPTSLSSISNFVEYFGAKVATVADVPYASVEFGRPTNTGPFTSASRLTGVCATAATNSTGAALLTSGGSTSCTR